MDYIRIEQAFQRLEPGASAPENHGALCGLLCARGQVAKPEWLALVSDGDEAARPTGAADAAEAAVDELFRDTVDRLAETDRLFQPLLPDDGQPLAVRSGAMAEWCSGFLYGLGAGGIGDVSGLPEDVQEIAGDIAQISRAETEGLGGEEDEAAYAELVEYLRAGVTLVYEILESERAAARDRTVH